PVVELPVVLEIPFDIGRTILPLEDADVRLLETVELPEQRVGVRMPGVVRVVRVVAERDGGGIAGRLILAAALVIESRLQRVCSDNLADVVIYVEGRVAVLIWELAVAGSAGKVLVRDAAEGDVEPLCGRIVRERQREIEAEPGIGPRSRISRIERQSVMARAENELVGQRRRERGRDVERAVPGRRLFEDQIVEW